MIGKVKTNSIYLLLCLCSLTSAQEFIMNDHVLVSLFQEWRKEAYQPRIMEVDLTVKSKDYKWDTENLEMLDEYIEGFIGASEATQIMWMTFIVTGSVILAFVYPLIALNEHKLLVLKKVEDTIEDKLYISKNGETTKENENKLIFV